MGGPPPRRPAVFLDRDGVLNEPVIIDDRPHPPSRAEDLLVQPATLTACRRLKDAALLVMVTNQPDIARGTQTREAVDAINTSLRARLPLDAVYLCPHDDRDGCSCRKPKPGMLLLAAKELNIDLERSVIVGDRWRDIEAGRQAGCRTVLVDRRYREPRIAADLVVETFSEAVPWILARVENAKQGG
jgi:D-glycero-D-manno-heptose 1,7-bisphosphate phosphatase